MSRRGRQWMQDISSAANRPCAWCTEVVPELALVLMIFASLPVVLGTLFMPLVLSPAVVLLSEGLLYIATKKADPMIFGMSRLSAYASITMPLCGFISLWGLGLAAVGRKPVMLGVVGPYALLMLLACAPAWRWQRERMSRRVPLKYSFPIVGAIVLSGSVLHA